MVDAPVPGKRRGGPRKSEYHVERLVWIRKVWGQRRTHWTGQSGRMLFSTIPATPDDGKKTEKNNYYVSEFFQCYTRRPLSSVLPQNYSHQLGNGHIQEKHQSIFILLNVA